MANSKISALTDGNPAQSGDEIPIARGGANYKITAGSIASLGGDVDGPASSTDNAVARFDSTTGKLIQNSGVTIDDSNNLTLPGQADLRFADSDSSNWVAFQAPATVASNVTWTLPNADGTSGQVLSTDGSGTLSWATGGGGGGSGTVTSVAFSAGTTGLSVSGSPITTSGTITLAGTLGVANGGTGATTLTGLVKGSGTSAFSAATAGTDYVAPAGAFSGLSWQSVQTTGFTAVAFRAYPCNTTSAAFTVTLPASPSAGAQITLTDYAGTFGTNALTINPNGGKIFGATANQVINNPRGSVNLVYVDATQGWIADSGLLASPFSSPPPSADFIVVAGGGGGGGGYGGGGGAGGYRTGTKSSITTGTSLTVTVGAGGAGSLSRGTTGSNSVFDTTTSAGGGGGGTVDPSLKNGLSGGSGGGGGKYGGDGVGGSGNTPSVSPSQGNNGGNGNETGNTAGGGGGASAVGGTATSTNAGNGGAGTASSITGSSVTYAGGGGGGSSSAKIAGTGGAGGGANGINSDTTPAAASSNLGGGGGGGGFNAGTSTYGSGSSGGSGVVILAYPNTYSNLVSVGAGLTCNGAAGNTTPDTTSRPGYKVYAFTAGTGTISW
jgi:hypothetical protein